MKNNVYTCKPQFYNIKVGLKRVKIKEVCFRDGKYISLQGISFCYGQMKNA